MSPAPAVARRPWWHAVRDVLSSTAIATISTVRGLTLLASGRPGTPLRALCIAAFDTLHTIHHGRRLSASQLDVLAALLDLGACANARLDLKRDRGQEQQDTLTELEAAGIGSSVAEYLRRLGDLESTRPVPGGDRWQFHLVRAYREAVVRLSLGIVAVAAGCYRRLDDAIDATGGRGDLNLLFRLAMQCQVIDDLLDYPVDRTLGLPSFLTACHSLPRALVLTRQAARGYAGEPRAARAAGPFPLQAALFIVSACAELASRLSIDWWPTSTRPHASRS